MTATTTASSTQSAGACPECVQAEGSRALSRRSLLKGLMVGAGAVVAAPMMGAFDTRVAYAAGPYTGDTLVVLSLRGGFDGLSAIVPAGDPAYYTLRPTIAIPANKTLQLDSMFGLHPSLAPFKALYDAGKFAPVHATGLGSPNRSHFSAMDELERAAPGTSARTGWLDRSLSLHDPNGAFGAVQVGSSTMPYSLIGDFPALGMDTLDGFKLDGPSNIADRPRWTDAMLALHSQADAALKESADSTISALAIATALQSPSYVPANSAVYPGTNLGTALKDVARMIKGNTKIRVATIDEGDWDMHSGLGTYDNGWMYGNLLDLGKAINAFVTDLGSGMDNVTLVTISEFGRRAQENDSQGVDHGWGNAMMVFSNNVNTAVHGVWPGLADDKLTDGDLTATTDYRKVLADILYNRCGSSVSEVTSVFPGFSGSSMGVMKPLP